MITLPLASPLPNIEVVPTRSDINIAAIDVYLLPLTNILDLHTIYELF